MAENPEDDQEPISLDVERASRFLHELADDPFIALVVTDDGEVRIFSKDIEPEHLGRIRDVLNEIREGA